MRWWGILVPNPPVDTGIREGDEVVRGSKDWFALSKEQVNRMMPKMKGLRMITAHGVTGARVGQVDRAFWHNGDACIEFTMDDTPMGQNANKLIESGLMAGLSLAHTRSDEQPQEVSICQKGAREGSWVMNRLPALKRTSSSRKDSDIVFASCESVEDDVRVSLLGLTQLNGAPTMAQPQPPTPVPPAAASAAVASAASNTVHASAGPSQTLPAGTSAAVAPAFNPLSLGTAGQIGAQHVQNLLKNRQAHVAMTEQLDAETKRQHDMVMNDPEAKAQMEQAIANHIRQPAVPAANAMPPPPVPQQAQLQPASLPPPPAAQPAAVPQQTLPSSAAALSIADGLDTDAGMDEDDVAMDEDVSADESEDPLALSEVSDAPTPAPTPARTKSSTRSLTERQRRALQKGRDKRAENLRLKAQLKKAQTNSQTVKAMQRQIHQLKTNNRKLQASNKKRKEIIAAQACHFTDTVMPVLRQMNVNKDTVLASMGTPQGMRLVHGLVAPQLQAMTSKRLRTEGVAPPTSRNNAFNSLTPDQQAKLMNYERERQARGASSSLGASPANYYEQKELVAASGASVRRPAGANVVFIPPPSMETYLRNGRRPHQFVARPADALRAGVDPDVVQASCGYSSANPVARKFTMFDYLLGKMNKYAGEVQPYTGQEIVEMNRRNFQINGVSMPRPGDRVEVSEKVYGY